jgi:hypothetical protein
LKKVGKPLRKIGFWARKIGFSGGENLDISEEIL